MIIWFDLVFVVHISFNDDIFLLSRLMNVLIVIVVLILTCCLLVNECIKVSSDCDILIVGAVLRINRFLLVVLY